MKNDFNREELQKWFTYVYSCYWCGVSHADCWHHITGRDSNSILNAAPLANYPCHVPIHGQLKRPENVKIFLNKTMSYLIKQGYQFTEKDKEFIQKYRKSYED